MDTPSNHVSSRNYLATFSQLYLYYSIHLAVAAQAGASPKVLGRLCNDPARYTGLAGWKPGCTPAHVIEGADHVPEAVK